MVGIGGWFDPRALSVGYDNIALMLQGGMLPASALLLVVVKALIWSVALGSGTSGGVLAPLLIMGGGLGAVLATVLPAASPGFWPLLAMCATMGGTMRSPLTATFFEVELTGNTRVLLPLIASCVTAQVFTVLLMRRSILTEKLARRGHHLVREYQVDPFMLTQVRDVMVTNVQTVPDTMTLHQAARFLADPDTKHPSFPIIDAERHVVGIIDPPAVLAWRRAGKHRTSTLRELVVDRRRVPDAYPDEHLQEVVDRMMQANMAHMPVISRTDSTLVGYIGWKDLLRTRDKKRAEETERVVLYRAPDGMSG
ncbi:MAG: chloride channel protein, partial [Acetobacteraceae bacterium]|nr:chloride channel protein [Acetobacteraceae bacterium]